MIASDNDLIRRGDALVRFPDGRQPWSPSSIRKAIDALPAVQVGVKSLEWVEGDERFVSKVCPLSGQSFTIAYEDGEYWPLGILGLPGFKTKDEAIAAVNKWREDHILSALTVQPSPDVAALVEALGWYADQFCEGFCQDLPSVGYTDENCERDCGGCKARAALAKIKGADHE